jgi:hypothetical protein
MTELNHDHLAVLSALDQQLVLSMKKNDRLYVLILACLDRHIITGSAIRAYLVALGFKPYNAIKVLHGGVTTAPVKGYWGRRADRTYFAHAEPAD